MHITPLLTASLLRLARALPAARPTTGTSTGFNLRVSVTDATRDLTPSVQGLYLADERVASGSAISVLTATASPTAFYLNGTAYHTTVTHDAGVYPLSVVISGPSSYDYFYPAEHDIGAAVVGGTELFLRAGEPILFPFAGGQYAACVRDFVLGGAKPQILTVRQVYGNETVPADCAPVEFVVECAVLPDLPAGSGWNHDFAFEVPCVPAAEEAGR
ncbi:hypothetical protein F4824DRAFT_314337 [Ustulina deusta]|nr:hypothetical protein F4823DRAFT_334141 [Ustulina deusta]KAI3341467.1 hypothetical protein F4824DRAFT_314337 [Ustulina deusta]